MKPFTILLATDAHGGLALSNGELPWKNTSDGKKDMNIFKKRTINQVVIMGRKTFDIIGILKNRINIVISIGRNDDISNDKYIICKSK